MPAAGPLTWAARRPYYGGSFARQKEDAIPSLNRSQQIALLSAVPLFDGLSKRQLNAIAQDTYERRVERGEVVTRQGEPGREFFMIADGNVRVDRDGKLLRMMSQGEFFGEIALIDGRLRSSTVTAETPVHLLCVHTQAFGALIKRVPGLSDKVMFALCRYVRRAEEALAKLGRESAG